MSTVEVVGMATLTKAEQRALTTRALLDAARGLFARHGYAQVSLADIVATAGVTKGALYHYFGGKDELFRAIVAEAHREVADRVASAAPDADPWTQLVEGCRAFLVASTEPGVQQILLVDAPSVLGWEVWRSLDAESSMPKLHDVLVLLMDTGTITPRPVAPLVHLLSGAMNEAAVWLARSPDRERDLAETMAALTTLLDALRSPR
jgi:AcrR family transcriptional regulator